MCWYARRGGCRGACIGGQLEPVVGSGCDVDRVHGQFVDGVGGERVKCRIGSRRDIESASGLVVEDELVHWW